MAAVQRVFLEVVVLLIGLCILVKANTKGWWQNPGAFKVSSIIGGIYAHPKQFPYQAYVRTFANDTVFFCGAAIISPEHVLTAAHCVNKRGMWNVSVTVGVVNKWSTKAITRAVKRKYAFQAKTKNIGNDIAILQVNQPFPNLPNVKAVALKKKRNYTSKKCVVSGWGDTKNSSLDNDLLKYVTLPIVEKEKCTEIYSHNPPGDLLCAGFMDGGKDTCQGDSGGPLVCDDRLVGIVKGGIGCGLPNFPGTYTEVAYYYNWIRGIIPGYSRNNPVANKYKSFYYKVRKELVSLNKNKTLSPAV